MRLPVMCVLLGGSLILPVVARAQGTAGTVAPRPTQGAYFEFQVTTTVRQVSGKPPAYPQVLREAHVGGRVLVQFVVDTAGVPEIGTFKVLESSHALFSDAVREALPSMRFEPATIGGRRVRQVVQQPFTFATQ